MMKKIVLTSVMMLSFGLICNAQNANRPKDGKKDDRGDMKVEMEKLGKAMTEGADLRADEVLAKHADWAEDILARRSVTADNVKDVLKEEIGAVFCKVLEHTGVYKNPEAFTRFIDSVNERSE